MSVLRLGVFLLAVCILHTSFSLATAPPGGGVPEKKGGKSAPAAPKSSAGGASAAKPSAGGQSSPKSVGGATAAHEASEYVDDEGESKPSNPVGPWTFSIFGDKEPEEGSVLYEQGRQLGQKLVKEHMVKFTEKKIDGKSVKVAKVKTGGLTGVMEAVPRGVSEELAKSAHESAAHEDPEDKKKGPSLLKREESAAPSDAGGNSGGASEDDVDSGASVSSSAGGSSGASEASAPGSSAPATEEEDSTEDAKNAKKFKGGIGVFPRDWFPNVELNPYVVEEKARSLVDRNAKLIDGSDVIIAFGGGLGTAAEFVSAWAQKVVKAKALTEEEMPEERKKALGNVVRLFAKRDPWYKFATEGMANILSFNQNHHQEFSADSAAPAVAAGSGAAPASAAPSAPAAPSGGSQGWSAASLLGMEAELGVLRSAGSSGGDGQKHWKVHECIEFFDTPDEIIQKLKQPGPQCLPPEAASSAEIVQAGASAHVQSAATSSGAAPSGAAPSGAAPSGAAPSGAAPSGAGASGLLRRQ